MCHIIDNKSDRMSCVDIATAIFNTEPKNKKELSILFDMDDNNCPTKLDLFEIFLSILVEGMIIKYSPITMDKMKTITEESILYLQPWMESIGFHVKVERIEDKEMISENYCKIIFQCDPEWTNYFEIIKYDYPYRFIFGDKSPYMKGKQCTFENMYAIFPIKDISGKKIFYKISCECA